MSPNSSHRHCRRRRRRRLLLVLALAAALFVATWVRVRVKRSTRSGNSDSGLDHHLKAVDVPLPPEYVAQDQVEIVLLNYTILTTEKGSAKRVKAEKKLDELISHRNHVDQSVKAIINTFVSEAEGLDIRRTIFPPRNWDWRCAEAMIAAYHDHCGTLKSYGMRYIHTFAKLCDIGIQPHQMAVASVQTCAGKVKPEWRVPKNMTIFKIPADYLSRRRKTIHHPSRTPAGI